MRLVRWGLLGTGFAAKRLAEAFGECQRAQLLAVGSRDGERAKQFAKQHGKEHGAVKAYGCYEAVLSDEEVEAVLIALPNTMHCEWTVKAAQAGKHVLCEKPLAMTVAEAKEMQRACERSGVLLMEAAMYRFQPQIAKVSQLIAEGRLGRLWLIRGAFCFPFTDPSNIRLKKEMGGGCLFDLGFYPVDFARLVTGEQPDKAVAFFEPEAKDDVEKVAAGSLHFPSGVIALFECGFLVDIKTNAELTGEEATLQIPDPWTSRGQVKRLFLVKNRQTIETFELPDPNAYALEIDHFSNCVSTGAPIAISPDDSMGTIQALEALRLSAEG